MWNYLGISSGGIGTQFVDMGALSENSYTSIILDVCAPVVSSDTCSDSVDSSVGLLTNLSQ